MSNNVNELYYFYGEKESVKKLYKLFSNEEFEFDGGYVEKLFDLDKSENSFKVEIYGGWNSCLHSIRNELNNKNIDIQFYMASFEESELWCFTDDVDSKLIKEDYVISYLPYEDEENPANPINCLTGKHYYTAEELKSIFDALYNKNETIEYYLDYFKQIREKDGFSCYEYTPEKFAVWIEKLSRGKKEDKLLCTYDSELMEELSDPDDEWAGEADMNSDLYVAAWLKKYEKENRKRGYYDIGLKWEISRNNKYKAFKWYCKGAEEGEVGCLLRIGEGWLGEYGREFFVEYADFDEYDGDEDEMAASYLKKAVDNYFSNGSVYDFDKECAGDAANKLGNIANLEESYEEANKWYEKALDLGCKECKLPYAINIFDGNGINQDKKKAISILKSSLENVGLFGEYESNTAYFLALMYEETDDFDEACKYYEIAANDDRNEAIKWLVEHSNLESNENDFADLQEVEMEYKDSDDFDKGMELTEDYEEEAEKNAFVCFKNAFDDGVLQACYELGKCYESGCGVDKNQEKAAECYAIGAFNEDAMSQYTLAECYKDGIGVKQNWGMAYKWYSEAYENGSEAAGKWLYNHGFLDEDDDEE